MSQVQDKKKKVLIPNRGVIALDIISSLKSVGLETILFHSPEDALSLPVKLADKSYKFFSSRLQDSYLDMEAIVDKALAMKVDYIHPGCGFLAEDPEFFRLCEENKIAVIGPGSQVVDLVRNKIKLRELARDIGIPILEHSRLIKDAAEFEEATGSFDHFPLVIKPLYGSGGRGIRVAEFKKEAQEQIDTLLRQEEIKKQGIFIEEYFPFAFHIEIPFFRDIKGNILFYPEIESSIQRRFQKLFQESPSPHVDDELRQSLYDYSRALIEKIGYVGFGYVEFILEKGKPLFSEINPTIQINSLIPEIHTIANIIKKQFAISTGELLHRVDGVEIIKPRYWILLISLMAENPLNNFQPSSGTVSEFFHYATLKNVFKTDLYSGARVSPLYDPFIGKILTFSSSRDHSIKDMKNFLENITLRGIKTNLTFLKHLLRNQGLEDGDTIIDFLNLKSDFSRRKKTREDILAATALFSAAFHIENQRKDYKSKLETMKQPGFIQRLFSQL